VPPVVAAVGAAAAFIGSSTILSSVVGVGLSVGLSFVSKALTPKPKRSSASGQGASTQVTVRDPVAARRLVYGRARVGGTIVYIGSTTNNADLHLIIALCEGQIDGFDGIYLDDRLVPLDGSLQYEEGFAQLYGYIGENPQTASASAIANLGGAWTESHKLDGVAYLYVRLVWDKNAWASGVPSVSALVRGRRIYDPRTTTTAWSDNPALILRDFLLLPTSDGGVGAVSGEIDEASFIAAANICDELVTLSGGGTEKRYTAGGLIELDEGSTPQSLVQSLLSACGGRLSFWGGKWRLTVAAWRSPTFTVTDAILRGPIRVETRVSRREQFNAIKGTFRDPADRYIAKDYPAITSSTFETEDGGTRVYTDLPLDWTQSASMAQRLAKIELYRSREPITAVVQCNLSAYPVVVGDVVNVTHDRWGWTNKTFDVVEVKWAIGDDMAPGIDLTLRETSSAVYDWSASEEQLLQASPATSFPNWSDIAAPSFTLAAGDDELFIAGDGVVQSRIKVLITPVANAFVDRWEIRWKLSSEATFTDPISIGAAGSNVWWITPIQDGSLYDVEVRALTSIGSQSSWAGVYGFLAIGKTAPPPDIATVSISNGVLRWEYPSPPADLAGFKVRYHSGVFVFWGSGVDAHSGLLSDGSFDAAELLTGQVTLMVKAVDTSGNESVNAAVVITDLGDPIVDNIIVDYDLHALGFPGTITSGEVSGGDLVGESTTLFWSTDTAPFYPPGQPLFWPAGSYGDILYTWTYTPALELADATMSIFSTIVGAPWSIMYRVSGDSLFWDGADEALFWAEEGTTYESVLLEDDVTEWLMEDNSTPVTMEAPIDGLFWGPAGDFLSWPGSLSPIRRALYEFQLSVSGGAAEPGVTQLRLVFDVPDIMETLGDVAVLAAGTRLPLTKTFRAITAVNLTVQAGPNAAVSARIEDKALIGPLVTARDAAGTAVDASIDAIVQGY